MTYPAMTTFARNWTDAEGDAFNEFCEIVSAEAGITFDQAATVFDVYRKARALKFDRTNRRYVVTHGALLDRVVLRSHAGVEVAR